MSWPLVVIIVAVAAFNLLLARRRRPGSSPTAPPDRAADQISGFLYVGAGSLGVLTGGVVVLGIVDAGDGRAETVAVLGLGAYAVYLVAAGVLTVLAHRRA